MNLTNNKLKLRMKITLNKLLKYNNQFHYTEITEI
jgi:hypothetical protein